MNMLRRGFLSLLCIIASVCCISMQAQNISVSSFKLMENDLTANLKGTIERDYNGEVAALIKVVTPEQGFTFDGGMVGIVKTKQEAGEVWVWVPHGIKKMSVRHPRLGVLRDYYFPISIEKARTYEMVLTTGKVQTIVSQSLKKQFVIFNVEPADATIEFNGIILPVDETGYAETSVPFGKYTYRISSPNYHATVGVVVLSEGDGKQVVNVSLNPNYSIVELIAEDGVQIWVDGENKGVGTWKGTLGIGDHEVVCRKGSHVPSSELIRIVDTTARYIRLKAPTPLYSSMEVTSSPSRAKVYVDGVDMGETPLILDEVLIGSREVVLEKEGFERQVRKIQVDYGVSSSLRVDLTENSSLPASLSSNAAATSITPMSSLTANENSVPSDGGNVIVNTRHSDNYTVYLDGEKKASFQGDRYELGYLDNKWGKHTLKLKGKRYVGGKSNFLVDSDPYVLDVKTRLRNNLFHTNGSFYLGIGAGVVDLNPDFFTQFNANVGVNVRGVNVEYNLTWDVYAEGFSHDVRLGYSLCFGGNLCVTSQLGYGLCSTCDYVNVTNCDKYYDSYETFLVACKVQYCLSRNWSLLLSTQYAWSYHDAGYYDLDTFVPMSYFDEFGLPVLSIGFRYTIPFRK